MENDALVYKTAETQGTVTLFVVMLSRFEGSKGGSVGSGFVADGVVTRGVEMETDVVCMCVCLQ